MTVDPDSLEKYKPTYSGFQYQNYPFYWIARVGNIYSQRMERVLKREGLNITGWRVGMILRQHGSLSISEISTHAAMKLSTVTRCVYLMQDKGLLSIRQRQADARVTEVRVTPAGLSLIARVIKQTASVFDRALRGLSPEQLSAVNTLLEQVYRNLSDDY